MTFRDFMWFLLVAPVWGLFLYAVGFAIWIFITDYVGFFRQRTLRNQPVDPKLLRCGFMRASTKKQIEKQKKRLRRCCEVRGKHVQRNSHFGLISHPLRMDE